MKFYLLACAILSLLCSTAFAEGLIALDFKLEDLNKECPEKEIATHKEVENILAPIQDPNFWKALLKIDKSQDNQRLKDVVYIIPVEKELLDSPEEMTTMGMNAKQSLQASGDQLHNNGCSEGHDQGTMNNRFCHSAIARTLSSWLEAKGVNGVVSSLVGGVFWVPKEYLIDLNPSAHDIAFTYTDKLGTKSTTFEFTMFGDALFAHYMGKDFAPMKSSSPFISVKRKF